MIRHIVWWTLKEHSHGRSAAENAWHIQQASAMLHGMPEVISVEVSAKVQPSSTVPAQVVLFSTHNNMEALEAYKNNPVHLKFAEMVTELSLTRNCIDYAVESSL